MCVFWPFCFILFLVKEGGQRRTSERASKVLVPEQEPLLPGSMGGTSCMSCWLRNWPEEWPNHTRDLLRETALP